MKHLAILLLSFSFVSCALGQVLPDNPTPIPDPAWGRLQTLVYGQPIVVDNTNGPPVHCLFAGVTDAYLFCNPPGNPPGAGFRIDHANVLSVASRCAIAKRREDNATTAQLSPRMDFQHDRGRNHRWHHRFARHQCRKGTVRCLHRRRDRRPHRRPTCLPPCIRSPLLAARSIRSMESAFISRTQFARAHAGCSA